MVKITLRIADKLNKIQIASVKERNADSICANQIVVNTVVFVFINESLGKFTI